MHLKNVKIRQMRGEDLQGLNLEDLKQLERKLEVGLTRVLHTKVSNSFFFSLLQIFMKMSIKTLIYNYLLGLVYIYNNIVKEYHNRKTKVGPITKAKD